MKPWLTLLFVCLCFSSIGRAATFEKLCEVNRCWREHKTASTGQPAAFLQPGSETAWIRLHLRLVEQALRHTSTAGLSAQQAFNRVSCLNNLAEYRRAGKFPVNENYTYRTPIFIDKHDNFCAVGYLLKASGNEPISRRIAASSNMAYVKEMAYPELNLWVRDNGFTIDELAWIQPGYPPAQSATAIGKGVDGEVMELFPDNDEGRLYVGGNFKKVDDTLKANSIAYLTEAAGVYTWHNLGGGMYGTVNAIAKYKGNIIAGGDFWESGNNARSVASWDGTYWSHVGCLFGVDNVIYDLAVMNGELYAVGVFDLCWGAKGVCFARWNDTDWEPLPGLAGKVNTMHVTDTTLVLGGNFIYNNTQLNVIRWSRGAGFRPFASGIVNEVTDFESFNDTLYAVCKRTNTIDSINLVVRLAGDQWRPLIYDRYLHNLYPNGTPLTINTLCADGGQLMMGGSFVYQPSIGKWGANCFSIMSKPGISREWFAVDSAINKMVIFKKDLIAGGRFKTGYGAPALNGIAKRPATPVSVPAANRESVFEYYPNPASDGGIITIRNSFSANWYVIRDANGRQLAGGALTRQASQQVQLPRLTSGVYFLDARNEKGYRIVKRLVVK